MSIPLHTSEVMQYTPILASHQVPKPVYHVKVPSVFDRARYTRELISHGVTFVTRDEFARELRASVLKYTPKDQHEEIFAILDAPKKDEAQAELIEEQIRDISPEYSRLLGKRSFNNAMSPLIAVQMFVLKADHLPQLVRVEGKLSEDSLQYISPSHLQELGGFIEGLMILDPEQRKNLHALSGSQSDLKNSTDGNSTKVAAKSKGKSTKKTRA
jgi:hypothetical protein